MKIYVVYRQELIYEEFKRVDLKAFHNECICCGVERKTSKGCSETQ